MKVILNRIDDDGVATYGELTVYGHRGNYNAHLQVQTLEPPWKENHRLVSCIPKGNYKLRKRNSEKYGEHYIVDNVEGRELILIHVGNRRKDTKGCILVGEHHGKLEGENAVLGSQIAMHKLMNILGRYDNEHELIIK